MLQPFFPNSVALTAVSKQFGNVVALDGISLELAPGRVHAFVGQNGAGKSTCLGIIAGRIAPSSGTVSVDGRTWPPRGATPAFTRAAGVAAIYQELSIVPAMSAIDNVFLGALPSRAGTVSGRMMARRFRELCERFGVDIAPAERASDLSLADQQMLEIMRGLTVDARVLLLDEPTAALAPPERSALFKVMRELRDEGRTLVFVSHFLDEVTSNADTISVFRDGHLVQSAPTDAWDEPSLVRSMLGAELAALQEATSGKTAAHPVRPRTALRLEELCTRDGLADVSLVVRAGEIVGIAGLVGSGRSRLLRTLVGLGRPTAGRMWIDDEETSIPRDPRQALGRGIGMVPEDRKRSGLLMNMSSRDNILIGDLGACSHAGVVSGRQSDRLSTDLAQTYGLKPGVLDRPARELSGGNQQKLLLARWGNRAPSVLLADEATRGIDIGAKSQILATLRELADAGIGVVFVSSDLEEVGAISDRMYVMRAGRVVSELVRGESDMSQDTILQAAFGLGGGQRA